LVRAQVVGKDLYNILTVDLEEWYHPEYVKDKAPRNKRGRAIRNLNTTLSFLRRHNVSATFFVVGELVYQHPEICEEILENGHEIGFHGYYHEPLWKSTEEKFRLEISKFDSLMKEGCIGFRAPSFSLKNETRWALSVLEDAGYKYDSSIFPTQTPLYGVRNAPMKPYLLSKEDVAKEDKNSKLWEFPLLVYPLTGFRVPMAGGFYLRFFPVNLMERAIKKLNKQGFPAVVFFHSWELDREIPKLKLGLYRSFVTYYNIKKVETRLKRILSNFRYTSFRNYIELVGLSP